MRKLRRSLVPILLLGISAVVTVFAVWNIDTFDIRQQAMMITGEGTGKKGVIPYEYSTTSKEEKPAPTKKPSAPSEEEEVKEIKNTNKNERKENSEPSLKPSPLSSSSPKSSPEPSGLNVSATKAERLGESFGGVASPSPSSSIAPSASPAPSSDLNISAAKAERLGENFGNDISLVASPKPSTSTVFVSGEPNGERCNVNSDCQSNNCQAAPGGKYCVAAGQQVSAKVKLGGTCGTTAYNRECETGLVCQSNKCVQTNTITYIRDGRCLTSGDRCESGGYSDTTCAVTRIRCGQEKIGIKAVGKLCTANDQCVSGNCGVSNGRRICLAKIEDNYASAASCQSECIASGGADYQCKQQCREFTTDEEKLVNTYIAIDTITFGSFDNYVRTYQDPETTTGQRLLASTQLGTTLVAEGAVATTGVGALASGGSLAGSAAFAASVQYANITSSGWQAKEACELFGPDSNECRNAKIFVGTAVLSGASYGASSALQAGTTAQTVAQAASGVASAVEVGVNTAVTVDVCSDFANGSVGWQNCVAQAGLTVLHGAVSAGDIAYAGRQIGVVTQSIDAIPNSATSVNAAVDAFNPQELRQDILNQLADGGENVTITLANKQIDELVAAGVDELEAINVVGSGIVPPYASLPDERALLGLADQAGRSADAVIQCPYSVCRHNSVISDAILESRGLNPQRATMQLTNLADSSPAGGHHTSVVLDSSGNPIFIDFTNNKVTTGVDSFLSNWESAGFEISELSAMTQQAPWTVTNLSP